MLPFPPPSAGSLRLSHVGIVHVVLGISDHALHHLAADGTGLAGSNVAVISLLEIDVEGIGHLGFEALQLLTVFVVVVIAAGLRFSTPC